MDRTVARDALPPRPPNDRQSIRLTKLVASRTVLLRSIDRQALEPRIQPLEGDSGLQARQM